MTSDSCAFCCVPADRLFHSDALVAAFWDAFPVSPGHALIIPRRHVTDWFAATVEEQQALVNAVVPVKEAIEAHYRPDAYNLGVNIGSAAGQTVFHLHLHVIPRYAGDVVDPRGGVRCVVPSRALYADSLEGSTSQSAAVLPHGRALVTGGPDDPLLQHLIGHLDRATAVDVAVAFTLESGVALLQPYLRDVLGRQGRVRILTGDYLGVTDPDALLRLLDLTGNVQARIFESAGTSFHPKSYIVYQGKGVATAFVGSSNLSASALKTGIEWNYRVVTSRDQSGLEDVLRGFESLWNHPRVRPLDIAWIDGYRRRRPGIPILLSGVAPEPHPPIPEPHAVQREALAALERLRDDGGRAGLVVLATGLGKTWLSAFDSNRAYFPRVLFVAHREEILGQAMETFRAIRPSAALGLYTGQAKVLNADVLFASIQTLSRREHLEHFAPHGFDYIIVDEFHHAAARTYRRLIEYFEPKFLLGLTATPERTDGGDLLALCGETLVYRCDLVDGIRRGLLAPFDYYGVPDLVDYTNIPWRSTRFDEEELTKAVATQARAENALEQYRGRAGTRTLGFCVSQRHADFMADFFRQAGLRAVAVHAGPSSAPRAHSLTRLQEGELDIVFAVDMFNEGVDLPNVDTVMMLRPTESQILWLQQFGRGLRWQPGKRLKVVDYIGNHRSFLVKPRTLLQLGPGDTELAYALEALEAGKFDLPPGCSVTYELEAKDMMRALLRSPAAGERLRAYYLDFQERNGIRPTALEAYNDGYDPKSARSAYGSWLGFVRALNGLTEDQALVHQRLGAFLDALETTPMTKSFKMVMLLAMLAEDALPGHVSLEQLTQRFAEIARRYALVRTELGSTLDDGSQLRELLLKNPINAWVKGLGTGGTTYFRLDERSLGTTFSVPPELHDAIQDLAREIIEWRLGVYLRRIGMESGADRIICKVSHAGGTPILFLPKREATAGIPEGWVDVITPDGVNYQAKFAKIAVNVLQRVGKGEENVLGEVLRGWFGTDTGQPGTTNFVEFTRKGGQYLLAPRQGEQVHGPQLWASYPRAKVPQLFGFEFKGFESQLGIVERDKLILLFVTLDKSEKPKEHQYEDGFLSAGEFRWQSQNKTARSNDTGQRIAEHNRRGIAVHLFVRPAAKLRGETQAFTYCGQLAFDRWEKDNPITVWWRLQVPIPERLWTALRVPPEG
jgi:superfamily II DNA or RNA helicase/HKD family nuclease/diadenosine tetraphosphate (Ap4A) HIT family hydrolase